ncbi:ECF-type sigma factor [Shewanella sp. KCT]|uniref:ECF-type sigma factor n=1 Tax=Shewanella sp. KCT TaxID=2569535 RepID=UPI00118226A9|nr:ECF-type sigma factor [Shewanella sp. KCT]TVP16340.1 RNA polymerase subunit sigma-70 [Shewanella sp. KCT]
MNQLPIHSTDEVSLLTDLVTCWDHEHKKVESQLYRFAYQKFRSIATEVRSKSLEEFDDNTWLRISCNTTSLVHDAFIRMAQSHEISVENSREFYILFSQVIYSILIDNLRKSQAKKRQVESDSPRQTSPAFQQLFELEHLLKRLALDYPRQVSVFIYKYVCLSSLKEIAQMLCISESSVDKDLSFIKKYLSVHLND